MQYNIAFSDIILGCLVSPWRHPNDDEEAASWSKVMNTPRVTQSSSSLHRKLTSGIFSTQSARFVVLEGLGFFWCHSWMQTTSPVTNKNWDSKFFKVCYTQDKVKAQLTVQCGLRLDEGP